MRRKKLKNKLEKLVNIKAIPILIAIFVCLLSIGYSAFQQTLLLDTMEMEVLKQSDINISDVSIASTKGSAVSLALSKKEGKITDRIITISTSSEIIHFIINSFRLRLILLLASFLSLSSIFPSKTGIFI